ncbi:MAG: cytochrome c oxidase subunit II [Euryarchaeota archaeon]|nr:cytochrome c oxidase subunit II [Euryarchaeota archaeon]
MRSSHLFIAVALCALAVAGPAAAQSLEDPGSSTQGRIVALYEPIYWIAIAIGVGVEGVILFTVLKYGDKGPGKRSEEERGHTKLEIMWTIPPALILLWVGMVSAQTLFDIETPPQEPDFEITVIGRQWSWEFVYPDGTSSLDDPAFATAVLPNDQYVMRVEAGKLVLLNVTTTDVIHSFNIPGLGVKLDSVPGQTNKFWFRADNAGEYYVQCTEYCGTGHAFMRGKVVVFAPGTQDKPFGFAAKGVDDQPGGPDYRVVDVKLVENGDGSLGISPADLKFAKDEKVALKVENAGDGFHNFKVDPPYNLFITSVPSGTTKFMNFTAEKDATLAYYCAVPGHRELGMKGTMVAGTGQSSGGGGAAGIEGAALIPGFEPSLFLAAVGAVALVRRRA